MTNSEDPRVIEQILTEQAKTRFGDPRSTELQAEIRLMAEQLAIIRTTLVDLQDEP